MSSQVQEKSKFQVVSACFSKLASFKSYHNQWRTNEQWASLVWAHFQDVLSPILDDNEELNGKLLDAAIKKDKVIKNNLQNYKEGTNAIGIMSRDYKPIITINGKTTRQIVRCYLTLPAYVGELPLAPGQSWWQTLPPT